MRKIFELYLASLIIICAMYFIWVYGYEYGCLFLFVPIIMVSIIGYTYFEHRMHDKECFVNCYIKEKSWLSGLLTGRIGTIIIGFFIGVFSIFPLLSVAIDDSLWFKMYALFHIWVIIMMYQVISIKFENSVKGDYLYILSRKLTSWISGGLIFLVYTYSFMHSNPPSYIEDTLSLTIREARNSVHSQCQIIDFMLGLLREMDAVNWWIVNKGDKVMDFFISQGISPNLKIFLWILFILKNVLLSLGINMFFIQTIYVIDKYVFNTIYKSKGD